MLGVLAFLVALLVLVLVHESGHFWAARAFGVAVEEFGFGFPPTAYQKKIGETTYSINWLPLGGFVRIKGEEESVNEYDSFSARPARQRASIVAAGVAMNLLLAIVLLTIGLSIGMPQELDTLPPRGALVRDVTHQVLGVLPDSPAAAILKPGDQIKSLDGETFPTRIALQTFIRSHSDRLIRVSYVHEGETKSAMVQPQPLHIANEAPTVGLGIELETSGLVAYPVYQAPIEATISTAKTFALIGATLWQLLVGLFHHANVGAALTGPIGIAVISGQVASLGFLAYLQFLALLSINLAFVNLIPFPGLDGGRLLFIGIEAVRGRPVSHSVETRFHQWGFVLLLTLILFVTYLDIRHFGGLFASWFSNLRTLL